MSEDGLGNSGGTDIDPSTPTPPTDSDDNGSSDSGSDETSVTDNGSAIRASATPLDSRIDPACPLPAVHQIVIDTDDAQPVVDKENYLNATITLTDARAPVNPVSYSTQIRGRGNSTWGMPKKPYKLKLDKKQELLGMSKGKKWALLANYADKTMLRNALAFCMAQTLGMPYTPQSEFAELTMNGEYQGLYQLSNKVYEIQKIIEDENEDTSDDPSVPTDDAFLLEIDWRLGEEDHFFSQSGIPYNFSSDTNIEQMTRVESWINTLEDTISDQNDPGRLSKAEELIDLDAMINLYLVNNLSNNPDAFSGSTYSFRTRAGRLTYGPVWDFDLAFSNGAFAPTSVSPDGWYVRDVIWNWYFQELLREPAFAARVSERWADLELQMPQLQQYLRQAAQALDAAQRANFAHWPILNQPINGANTVVTGSYQGEVDYLSGWLNLRAAWISNHIGEIDQF